MANDNLMYALPLTFLFYLKAGAIGIFAIAQIGKFNIDDFKFKYFLHCPYILQILNDSEYGRCEKRPLFLDN